MSTDVNLDLFGRLLSHGYLPNQVPPVVSTELFASLVSPSDADLDVDTSSPPKNWSTPARFNAARAGGLRRRLSINNPHSHVAIGRCISSTWDDLEAHYAGSRLSLSRPNPDNSRRALEAHDLFRLRDDRRLSALATSRFRLQTDISQCYSSMYTHSLSWALTSKEQAKANIGNSGFPGAMLDRTIQASQEGQTIGLQVGPDTSLAAAEVILCAIDTMLDFDSSYVDGFRTIDDFELFFTTRAGAEGALREIEMAVAHFELALNPHKTLISSVPLLLEDLWKSRLQVLAPRGPKIGRARILSFLNELMDLSRAFPGEAAITYGLQQVADLDAEPSGKHAVIEVAMAAMQFSAPAMRVAIPIALKLQKESDFPVERVWDAFNQLALQSAPGEFSYEVTWALFGLLKSGGKLVGTAAERVAEMNDPTCLAVYMYLREIGRADGPPAARLASLASQPRALLSDGWMLLYEAAVRGWHAVPEVQASPFFSTLASRGVTFLPTEPEDEWDEVEDWTFGLFNSAYPA